MAYIDKITNKDTGESRPISPVADKVRVNNDNFEGSDLDVVLNEIAEAIGESGGYTPPQGGIPKTDLTPAVQTSLDKADTAYQKPASGIPASDLASGVIPDVSGFATKTEVNAKANSADVYTKSETDAAIEEAVENVPTGDIPTKVSELENDEGYQTHAQVDAAIATAMQDGVTGINADFTLVKVGGDYYLEDNTPQLEVSTPTITMRGETKTATFKVSGRKLRSGISIGFTGTATNWSVSPATIAAVNGVVEETTVTVTYSGTDTSTAEITVSTTDKSATIAVEYKAAPVLALSSQSIEMSSGAGEAATATVQLTGSNLETASPIGVAVSGSGFSVEVTSGSLTPSNGAVNATLTITRASGASDTTGTLTVTDMTDGITLTAAVQWSESVTEAVGKVVQKLHAYATSEDTSPNVNIKYMITKMAGVDGSTTNEVKVVDKLMEDNGVFSAHAANVNQNTSYQFAKVEIPETIKINNNYYDVTELGEGCFAFNRTKHYIKFPSAGKLAKFSIYMYGGNFLSPFYNSSLCGAGTGSFSEIIGSKTFDAPAGLAYWQCAQQNGSIFVQYSDSEVEKLVIPDSLAGGSANGNKMGYIQNNNLKDFDFGTGITNMNAYLIFKNGNVSSVVFRYIGVVTPATNLVIDSWPSSAKAVKMYVPDAQVANYKANSTWANYIWDATNNPSGKIELLGLSELTNS